MRRLFPATAIPAALAAITLLVTASTAAASTPDAHPSPAGSRAAGRAHHLPANVREACPEAGPGQVRCLAQVRTDIHGGHGVKGPAAVGKGAGASTGTGTGTEGGSGTGTAHDSPTPADSPTPEAADDSAELPPGYSPADIHSAYNLPSTGGSGQTVAVVEAYDNPTAEADLAVYRTTYGLPPCTTADGCFTKVNQEGRASDYPDSDAWTGWSLETALDVDAVAAVCPSCHILLVEADSPYDDDMAAAEDTAARLGATEISNSFGEDEGYGMFAHASSFSHPGVAITAASGDYGFGVPQFPAVLPSVTSVGGTSLVRDPDTARGWSETAWSGSGSGCSGWFDKPDWQQGAPDCPGRVTADVSADADPDTGGLAVYDTTPYRVQDPGWMQAGGTSLASPIVASVIALAGNPGDYTDASRLYRHTDGLYDVTEGHTGAYGFDCGGDNLCNSTPGYDGPTGLGTPNGLGAF